MSLMARDRKEASIDEAAMRRDEALDPENDTGSSTDDDGARQDLEATEDSDHDSPDESLRTEQPETDLGGPDESLHTEQPETDHSGPDESLHTEQPETDLGGPDESLHTEQPETDLGGPDESLHTEQPETDHSGPDESLHTEQPETNHGGPDESLHTEQLESGAQAEGATVDTDNTGQGDAAVTVHRSPRWYFSGRLKPRSRNRGAIKPASMAAAALRKLFRGERHRLSTGANHNEPKKKKESAEGGSRLLSLCAGKASSERGQGKAARKPAEGASPRAPGSPTAAGGGGDTTADAAAVAVPSSRSTRSPRNRVAPCSQQAAVRARRLMRELQEIRRQQTRGQQPSFTVDLVEDNLYEWHVRLYQVDPESPLWRDMQESGVSCVQLSVSFPENFPFAPPFVRVLAPHIERGFVMEGGAICMELLTPRGWASAYTVEAILVQVAASLSKGQARIATKPGKQFNRKLAESSFRSLVKTHDKYGWVTPPLADG